jgi:hypothetical protein
MRYQIAQSVGMVGIWFVAWLCGFWLMGKMPFVPEVAWADSVQAQVGSVSQQVAAIARDSQRIERTLASIQALQLRTAMEVQLKNACLARRSHNQQDLDNANAQLDQMRDTYNVLAGKPFDTPSCSTILVDTK